MSPGGPTEAIRFFAGHMHVYDIALHIGDVYLDPAYPGKVGTDHDPWTPPVTRYSPFDLVQPIPINITAPDPTFGLVKAHVTHHWAPHIAPVAIVVPPVDLIAAPQVALPGLLIGTSIEITAATVQPVFPPASSVMVNIGQINHLVNTDYVGVDPSSHAVQMSGAGAPAMINSMLNMAHDLVPGALDTADTNGNILITHNVDAVTLINANDAAMANEPASHPTVAAGEYVNGVFDANYTTPFPLVTVPDQPLPPINIQGQLTPGLDLVAGGNSLVNSGAILDFNPHSTLMVLGDAYRTNAIFQVNILHDVDKIAVAAPQDLVHILTGDDSLNNYASFHNTDLNPSALFGPATASDWHVEVQTGNFYNVNVLAQTNVMVDGDVSYQTTQTSYYQLVTGANHQFNGTILDSEGQPFDLVIVLGNYHNANIIYQTNVVLNDDVVKALLAADNGKSLSISTGDNSLTNEADISNYGPNVFSPMSQELAEHAHNAQGGAFDPLVAGNVPGGAPLNVLFVTGDYYDVNIVTQINVLSDSNTAMQLVWGSAGPATSATETISTGSDQAANLAQIVDVNTIGGQFIAGNQYSDSLLFQANILTTGSTVDAVNPNALVNEVVAFLDHDAATAIPAHLDIPGTGGAAHHDVLGGGLA